METVSPITVIDLRDSITCARCDEPLAISAYDYNGNAATLLCVDCCALGATSVAGTATVASSTVGAGVAVDA